MGAGQKRQAAVMLDDAVVVLGEAKLAEGIVKCTARGNEKHGHVQSTAGLWRFLFFGQSLLLDPGGYIGRRLARRKPGAASTDAAFA
jgi:hypothetical protein